jgi:hypothetical protein
MSVINCEGCPRLLGFAIYVWTIRTQVVQIHIAISVAWEAGRLARYSPRRLTFPRPYGGAGPRNRPPTAARRVGQSVEVVVATPPVKVT